MFQEEQCKEKNSDKLSLHISASKTDIERKIREVLDNFVRENLKIILNRCLS